MSRRTNMSSVASIAAQMIVSHILSSSSLHRIPEGQAEAGSLAAGRLRSLEDQLTRAKQKIHSFQKLTGDGRHGGGGGRNLAQSLEIRVHKVHSCGHLTSWALILAQPPAFDGGPRRHQGQGCVCVCHTERRSEVQGSCQVSGEMWD